LIISSIPWDPATARKNPEVGEWVGKREPDLTAPPTWVYQITETNHVTANAKEYKRTSSAGRIQATSPHDVTISLEGYRPVRVLTQEGYGATLKIAKDIPPPGKKTTNLLDIRNWLHPQTRMGSWRLALATNRQYQGCSFLQLLGQQGVP
jgi:hypothetical protein